MLSEESEPEDEEQKEAPVEEHVTDMQLVEEYRLNQEHVLNMNEQEVIRTFREILQLKKVTSKNSHLFKLKCLFGDQKQMDK